MLLSVASSALHEARLVSSKGNAGVFYAMLHVHMKCSRQEFVNFEFEARVPIGRPIVIRVVRIYRLETTWHSLVMTVRH
jgi:hypothetical protein